jgi:ABC-type multidrug transport system fused ATPase/permease subunit
VVDVEDSGPDEGQAKFRIRDLKKESDAGVPILNGINVDIPKGGIVGIIGPSGSGKSTLLRALNRLWEPPLGTVFLDGRDICDLDVLSLRRKVGMLFQLPALFEGTVSFTIIFFFFLDINKHFFGPTVKVAKFFLHQVGSRNVT